jgi:hypothetical protein
MAAVEKSLIELRREILWWKCGDRYVRWHLTGPEEDEDEIFKRPRCPLKR